MVFQTSSRRRSPLVATAAALLIGLVLVLPGCSGEAILDNNDPPGDNEPPPPPVPGVDAGTLRIQVNGISASASSGGEVTATPTGGTPGDEVTVTVPTTGSVEWETVVGSYDISYEPPPDHSIVGQNSRAIEVDLDETVDVTFTIEAGDGSPPSPPMPPPPSEDCTVVVMGGQSPQSAVDAAQPGDVICLNGTFDLSLGVDGGAVISRNGLILLTARNSGTADRPITLRNEPGAVARIVGDFDAVVNLYVYIDASNWVVAGLTIETGAIIIGVVDNVQVVANTISRPVFPDGNAGGVRSLGGTPSGASNVFIIGNLIQDVYGCNSGPLDACTPGTVVPWNQVTDLVHIHAISKQGVDNNGDGLHVIRGNIFRRVPGLTHLKHESNDVVVIEDNVFEDAQWSGNCNTTPEIVDGNTYTNVGAPDRGCPRG